MPINPPKKTFKQKMFSDILYSAAQMINLYFIKDKYVVIQRGNKISNRETWMLLKKLASRTTYLRGVKELFI
jgi:hypothetical protein